MSENGVSLEAIEQASKHPMIEKLRRNLHESAVLGREVIRLIDERKAMAREVNRELKPLGLAYDPDTDTISKCTDGD